MIPKSYIINIVFDPLRDLHGRIQVDVGFGTYSDCMNSWKVFYQSCVP